MIKGYYGLRCPHCDSEFSNIEDIRSYAIFCPKCEKKFTLYQVISYNMWLAENNKATKLDSKPGYFSKYEDKEKEINDLPSPIKELIENMKERYGIEDVNIVRYNPKQKIGVELEYDREQKDPNDEDLDFDLFERVHNGASETAAICYIQYNYLREAGFNDKQAMHVLDKLIDNDIIFYGGMIEDE